MTDEMRRLRDKVGTYAYRRLREGKASLHCWRGSSPWNWWVAANKGGQSHVWHSDAETGNGRPSLDLFDRVDDSKEKIPHSPVHREGGLSFSSRYVLKPEYRRSAA
jgi:hypothetical protein